MKTIQLLLLALLVITLPARADVEVRVSVKFIKNFDGSRPVNVNNIDLSTSTAFAAEITYGNTVLAATGRGYKLRVVEYLDIQPPAPAGQAADYWYTLPARSNRSTFEAAAQADMATWRWNNNGALNIYVNNSSSGSCSFIGSGVSISMGSTIFTQGTIVHEIGHFFNLSHTHTADSDCSAGPYSVADGDGLAETIPDQNCLTRDQLSMANFGGRAYAALTAAEQAAVDTSWLNVMSYHQEERFLDIQMDYWATAANGQRSTVCSGRTWFTSTAGSDIFRDGLSPGQAFRTVGWSLAHVTAPDDVVLLRSGAYTAPATITTACTLCADRGAVTLTR